MIESVEEISDDFRWLWSGYGGLCIDCGCGRTHFTRDERAGDWEPGELEHLLKMETLNPDKYFGHDDSPGGITIYGRTFVIGCKCEYGPRFEQMIWHCRKEIATYLKKRCAAIVKWESVIEADIRAGEEEAKALHGHA